jgi:hypothetical protein
MKDAAVPIQTRIIKVESKVGVTVHNPLMVHDDPASDNLMVMLPGQGYSCNHPVLYYVRRMAIKHGFDVLSVEYGFQAAHLELDAQNTDTLQDDVWRAVKPVLEQGYRQVCIVGKSLGTPLAAHLAKTISADRISLILMTPIGGAFQGVEAVRTLAVMGTSDPLYSTEVVTAFPNIEWQVFDGLNHSLEVKGDWKASIAALERVIAVCEAFIER